MAKTYTRGMIAHPKQDDHDQQPEHELVLHELSPSHPGERGEHEQQQATLAAPSTSGLGAMSVHLRQDEKLLILQAVLMVEPREEVN